MPTYRIRWTRYRINGSSEAEAHTNLCAYLAEAPEMMFDLELDVPKKPVWKRLVFGD